MPLTQVTQLYRTLLNDVPEHMAALNICLVKGCLRPATLVEPDGSRNTPVDIPVVSTICENAGLLTQEWLSHSRLGPSLLVYTHKISPLVEKLSPNQLDHVLFGEVLGYRSLGDLSHKGTTFYFINFVVHNPRSGNENPFMGYICNVVDTSLIQELRNEAMLYLQYLEYHEITDELKLYIFDNHGNDIHDEWL